MYIGCGREKPHGYHVLTKWLEKLNIIIHNKQHQQQQQQQQQQKQ